MVRELRQVWEAAGRRKAGGRRGGGTAGGGSEWAGPDLMDTSIGSLVQTYREIEVKDEATSAVHE